ncbi:single-strand DNA-binding protein [Lachnospiraceae bacterium RM5]|nr:single-strand DNA-binding protein [Lachnospiraceae bacterium RM5]
MNKVIIMGRLTRDPDVRYSQGDTPLAVARFTLAVDRRGRKSQDQQTADFISCVAFGKTGEFIEKYCHQGTKLVLDGRIQTGSYVNKDGNKVYTTDVVAENVEFAESKSSAEGYNAGSTNEGRAERPEPQNARLDDGFVNIDDGVEDEGLPFA